MHVSNYGNPLKWSCRVLICLYEAIMFHKEQAPFFYMITYPQQHELNPSLDIEENLKA